MPFNHGVQYQVMKYDIFGTLLWIANEGNYGTMGYLRIGAANVDNAGNLFFIANTDVGGFFTYAYSIAGDLLWRANRPNVSWLNIGRGLALDSVNDVIVTGKAHDTYDYNSAYGTYKISRNGAYVWSNNYPNLPITTNSAITIALDQRNNVYITGYSPGTNSGNDIVTIKYDNNGNQMWLQRYNGAANGDDEANAIAVDANGNVYVTGYETVAGGGTEMVTIKYAPGPLLQKQSNGSFLLQSSGSPGQTFGFQASTNLQTWQDLGTNSADTNGAVQFLDTNAPLFPYRFYQANPQ